MFVIQRNPLQSELLWLLPGEILVCEVAILRSLEVNWLSEIQFLDDDTWSHVEVLADDLNQLVTGAALGGGSIILNEDGERLGNTDGVRKLDQAAADETGGNERLGDPTGEVSGGSVDLGVILSGESTSTVGTPSTVGVDDDLTASQTGVTLWTTNDEETGRLDLVVVSVNTPFI
jgi:hypothetical protein